MKPYILSRFKELGINAVAIRVKKYAHYSIFSVFIKDNVKEEALFKVKGVFKTQFNFIRRGNFKHDCKAIIDVVV